MQQVAISACLLGENCKYNGENNLKKELIAQLRQNDVQLIAFCPEDTLFGTPRPTMDLILIDKKIEAQSNQSRELLTNSIQQYAQNFFDKHPHIEVFIGKSRSPSCGVGTTKLYDEQKNLISNQSIGIMANEAKKRGIQIIDSEEPPKEENEKYN